jgi:hypothetical protein
MRIEINNHHTQDGKEFYYWTLNDGPENEDEVKGFATDLIEVFSKIIEWRERISKDYNDDNTTENNEALA